MPIHKGFTGTTRTEFDWVAECQYIADVTAKGGCVREMNNDRNTFINYCEMQQKVAEREGRHDSATYIGECLDDLRAAGPKH